MKYTAVIRTLGKGGTKYQRLLDSLCAQTIVPTDIIVYIAEGYDLPKETCGREKYVLVKKGMVAQRALPYDEVQTEYILFLDDDLYLPADFVENMASQLIKHNADIISPDIYPNHKRELKSELFMTVSGRMRARRFDNKWGYKVMRTGGYSYNKYPAPGAYLSQTNAGACFLCRKTDFLKIRFSDELWLDNMPYPIGEDQAMYYKMYLAGLKQLTLFGSGIEHLDGDSTRADDPDRELRLLEADTYFKTVFFHRFTLPYRRCRIWSRICFGYYNLFTLGISLLKGQPQIFKVKRNGMRKAKKHLNSQEYIPLSISR